ncbi:hypothetical protein [Herbidospora mongoliensis]|uniref:hypothetical protein n=1 Tax=Herbidospora mongoliensis TaxID=688067 RepID=UPI000830C19B|nr:hypothetical protein [Herbidospora mongoliensis]
MRWVAVFGLAAALTACGAPADKGFTPQGAAPSKAAVEAPPATAETITITDTLKISIEWPDQRDDMIAAFADSYVDQWKAVASGGTDDTYLAGVEDDASRTALAWVTSFTATDTSAQGTAKLYSIRVAAVDGRGAEIDACVDTSGIQVIDETDTPVANQPNWTKPPKSIYLQVAAVRRGDDGTWRVKLFKHAAYPDQAAKECQR